MYELVISSTKIIIMHENIARFLSVIIFIFNYIKK